MIEEEEREDSELRKRFKEKWKRETSSKLTETLKKEVRVAVFRNCSCSMELPVCVRIGGKVQDDPG